MIRVREEPNPNALAQVLAQADAVQAAMAGVGEKRLRENVSAGPRSGVHYPGQPRPSSTPTEMPQEQEGDLKGMVDSGKLAPCKYFFGFAPKNPKQAAQARTQELGFPRGNVIARAPGLRTALDSRTHAEMIAEGKRVAG